jgi:hypothetical protein
MMGDRKGAERPGMGNRSWVDRDKRTEGVESRSYFPDSLIDQTGARNAPCG